MWKVLWKYVPECSFGLPKSSFGEHNIRERFFKVLFKGSCTRFWAHADPEIPDYKRCSYGQETSFEGMYDKSGFGDFGDWPQFVLLNFTEFYAPQTKILDDWTKRCVCVFEVLFNWLSTLFGLPLFENSFKNAYATLCSTLENSSFGEHKFCVAISRKCFFAHGKIFVRGEYIFPKSSFGVSSLLHMY